MSTISEARDLAMLICPMAFQLEDGDAIDRMPDDLFRAANMLGTLCDALIAAAEILREERAHLGAHPNDWKIANALDRAINRLERLS